MHDSLDLFQKEHSITFDHVHEIASFECRKE